MESMDISPHFKTTSLAVPSPTATHVACLFGARLQIRCLASFEIIRSIYLPSSHDLRSSRIAWAPPSLLPLNENATPPRRNPAARSFRVLVADDYTTRVYDLRDEKWNAVISNGSGGMGKNVHVDFGASEDEVVVFSDFTSKASVWCLKTGRTVEVKDPKFSGREGKGWGYRPVAESSGAGCGKVGGVLALLCRIAGQDVLLLLASGTYDVLKRIELQTIDAVGVKWSRDGRWIGVWDAPSSGYKLCIYTADGHLYRTLEREPSDDPHQWGVEGLGIKTVEWVPGNKWLAVGGWDRRVRILSTKTFSPVVFLDHTPVIHVPTAPVYTEQVDAQGNRTYSLTQQPVTPPKAQVEKSDKGLVKQGISILSFNTDGTLCATRDDSTPTTVWIWDLTSLRPRTILTQHSPIKSLQWHHNNPACLLIQTTHDSPTVYKYTVSQTLATSLSSSSFTPGPPEILSFDSEINKPASSVPIKWTTSWLPTHADRKPAFSLGHQQGYILIWPDGKDQILRFEREDGEESDDSLYDILTGRTPVPRLHDSDNGSRQSSGIEDSGRFQGVADEEPVDMSSYEGSTGSMSFDDTFREKRRKAGGGVGIERGKSVFDESGLDEMF